MRQKTVDFRFWDDASIVCRAARPNAMSGSGPKLPVRLSPLWKQKRPLLSTIHTGNSRLHDVYNLCIVSTLAQPPPLNAYLCKVGQGGGAINALITATPRREVP